MKSAPHLELAKQYLYGNYRPAPVVFVRGEGCSLYDEGGKRYLDLCAGVAVSTLGHAHPELTKAIAEQAARVIHVSNYFYNAPNIELAEALVRHTGLARAFFCNSGAEANEAMLKLARRYHYARGDKMRQRMIAFHNAFHGRTMGALTLTGTPKYREGFGQCGPTTHVAYGDLDQVRAAMGADVAGIVVEPVQGEGGVLPAPEGFLVGLRKLADEHGALLLVDEVQTGMGRLGKMFGFQGQIEPDAIALAKGLAGGVPIGAMVTNARVADALPPGTHGSTFGGNPLACSAALAVLRTIENEKLCDAVRARGQLLTSLLKDAAKALPNACEGSRGVGLLQGLILREGLLARDWLGKILDRGVLLTAAGERVLRFTPPLIVSDGELREGVRTVVEVLKEIS